MPFMQRQITGKCKWLEVETTHGTEIIPQELVADVSDCDAENVENMPLWFNTVQQYTEGEPKEWKWIEGYGARLSAPGYMDCTDWTVFDSPEQAQAHLEEMYPEDEDEDEN
jgi:hypothetical protein